MKQIELDQEQIEILTNLIKEELYNLNTQKEKAVVKNSFDEFYQNIEDRKIEDLETVLKIFER